MDAEPAVFLVCDRSKTRRQLAARLRQLGFDAETYRSMEQFHARPFPADAGCVVLFLSGADSDLDWLRASAARDGHWPVVAIAAEADVETAVKAMKDGACDFLLESCSNRRFSAAIEEALRWDAARRRHIAAVQSARRRMEQLPPSLREVLDLLLKGRSNREVAGELNLSERTIEDRRARIMRAMKARTVVALVRQVLLAEAGTAAERWSAGRPDRAEGQVQGRIDAGTKGLEDANGLAEAIFSPSVTRPSPAVGPLRRSRGVASRNRPAKPAARHDPADQDRRHDRQPKRAR
jgi:FixJ family two-component response regulator